MTGAYVSLKNGMPSADAMPHNPEITMKTYLKPTVSEIKPPAIGPTAGPMRGPRLYTAMADARSFSEKRSLMVPPPQAIGALPTKPPDGAAEHGKHANHFPTRTYQTHANQGPCVRRKGARKVEC